jgi:hypothetical protein
MSAIFLWLILNVLLVTAVLQNSMSSVSATQIVKMAWYDDMRFKQWTVTKFLVAGKESIIITHRWLKNVYGVSAVDKSTISRWPTQTADSEKGHVDLSDVYQSHSATHSNH